MRDYLDSCRHIEQVMNEVYRKLAAVEAYSDELRGIFRQLASDEADHARQLEMAGGVPQEIFFAGMRLDADLVERLLLQSQRLLKLVDAPPGGELEILELAKRMEREFMQVHLLNAVNFHGEELADLFRDLARSDEAHFQTLEAYCRQRGSRPASPEKCMEAGR